MARSSRQNNPGRLSETQGVIPSKRIRAQKRTTRGAGDLEPQAQAGDYWRGGAKSLLIRAVNNGDEQAAVDRGGNLRRGGRGKGI